MRENDFKELEKLRLKYKKRKQSKLEKQRLLRDCQNSLQRKVNEKQLELKYQKADLMKDKELRAEAGITNQNDWKVEVDKRCQCYTDEIKELEDRAQDKIKQYERDIEDLNIQISDLHWELTIKLEYYKTIDFFDIVMSDEAPEIIPTG